MSTLGYLSAFVFSVSILNNIYWYRKMKRDYDQLISRYK